LEKPSLLFVLSLLICLVVVDMQTAASRNSLRMTLQPAGSIRLRTQTM
jgi:hypothetical protein